jgi:predicted glycogen debranching enzyme
MSYIVFEKSQLINLGYSLKKELLRTNRAGSYASTTIIGCNTRKYHGLLVTPQPEVDGGNHILLSTLDETVIQHNAEFNLALHKFKGDVYLPRGHKYIRDFTSEPTPKLTYRVGGVVLTKEHVFSQKEARMLIRYTLQEAHSPTILRFKPFLAFRNVHQLTRANVNFDNSYRDVRNGISVKMYDGYTPLYLQFSKEAEYVHVPDWYYDIEYPKERERGYEYLEDLYAPGFFEVPMKKGESLIFSAGTTEVAPGGLKRMFTVETTKRTPRDSYIHCLENSAQQFILEREGRVEVVAGFPWYAASAREALISLPGILLAKDEEEQFHAVLDSLIRDMEGPLFPSFVDSSSRHYNSVDAPLWFFWTLQQYLLMLKADPKEVWKKYGAVMERILRGYTEGTRFNIRMLSNGLIYAGEPGNALTWMNARAGQQPITPRIGMPVEVNALWYNALMFYSELASKVGDTEKAESWKHLAAKVATSFTNHFWSESKGYLADFINGEYHDFSVRPNQLFAISLPYSPLPEELQKPVLDVVTRELLTERGLRTLTPKSPAYKGHSHGTESERGLAYHNGTAYPWLIGAWSDAMLNLYGKGALAKIKKLYSGFEETMLEAGIGSVSEVYDGDPPQEPGGAFSYAPSVGELLRLNWMLTNNSDKK